MASDRSSRAMARKLKDKWRSKVWYTLVAPEFFDKKEIGETPAASSDIVIGRIAESTLYDFSGNVRKMHVKLYFRVKSVEGTKASTQFIGHDMSTDYIKRLVRRRRSRIDAILDVTTIDGYKLRVKVMGITEKRIGSSKKKLLHKAMNDFVSEKLEQMTFAEAVKYIISDNAQKELYTALKKIYPMRNVELRKSELLSEPA